MLVMIRVMKELWQELWKSYDESYDNWSDKEWLIMITILENPKDPIKYNKIQ